MRPIGFSTGALAKEDFRAALQKLGRYGIKAVELSALRLRELPALVDALPDLDLSSFRFVSFHAPSSFQPDDEQAVISHLRHVVEFGLSVIVHPDVIFQPAAWRLLGPGLVIENMDKRKAVGRTAAELAGFFHMFPDASLCFDIGHARQVDPTMTEAKRILKAFGTRLSEIHISEVNTNSRHDPISNHAVRAFRTVADLIPPDVPAILETLIDAGQSDLRTEMEQAALALEPLPEVALSAMP